MYSRKRKKPGRKSNLQLVGAKTFIENKKLGISNKIDVEKEKQIQIQIQIDKEQKIKELTERTLRFIEELTSVITNDVEPYLQEPNDSLVVEETKVVAETEVVKEPEIVPEKIEEKATQIENLVSPEIDIITEINVTMNQNSMFYHVDDDYTKISSKEKLFEDGNDWLNNLKA